MRRALVLIPAFCLVLVGQETPTALLRVGESLPVDLDLTGADPAALLPRDNRDAAQVEAARQRWNDVLESRPFTSPMGMPRRAVARIRVGQNSDSPQSAAEGRQ